MGGSSSAPSKPREQQRIEEELRVSLPGGQHDAVISEGELFLESRQLLALPPSLLDPTQKLGHGVKCLYLDFNRLTSLDGVKSSSFPQLTHLSAAANCLHSVDSEICSCTKLQVLNLGGNKLNTLPSALLSLSSSLTELHLQSNLFTPSTFPGQLIVALSCLKVLDLASNVFSTTTTIKKKNIIIGSSSSGSSSNSSSSGEGINSSSSGEGIHSSSSSSDMNDDDIKADSNTQVNSEKLCKSSTQVELDEEDEAEQKKSNNNDNNTTEVKTSEYKRSLSFSSWLLLPPSLLKLNLSTCGIQDECENERRPASHLATCVPLLQTLVLNENNLCLWDGPFFRLNSLKNLTVLHLACNSLQKLELSSVELPLLRALDVSCNLLRETPNEILNFKLLTDLDISSNPIATEYVAFHEAKCGGATPSIITPSSSSSLISHTQQQQQQQLATPFSSLSSNDILFELSRRKGFKLRASSPSPDLILPRLYLGDWPCARNQANLKVLGITHVLTVAHYLPPFPHSFHYHCVAVDDADAEDLHSKFNACNQFIDQGRAKGGVLIHCRHGVSRSATVMAAYIWALSRTDNEKGLPKLQTPEDALAFVRAHRPRIGPNEGFKSQLRSWARDTHKQV